MYDLVGWNLREKIKTETYEKKTNKKKNPHAGKIPGDKVTESDTMYLAQPLTWCAFCNSGAQPEKQSCVQSG